MAGPKFTKVVSELPAFFPFVGPEAQERETGIKFRVRLGANESVFGPSPKAIAAMAAAARDNWMYSDPENFDLRSAIARHHRVDIAHVVIGEGIDGLLGLTVTLFVEPGDAVVTSDGAYPTFNYHVAGHGGQLVKIPFHETKEDWQRLAEAAHKHRAKVVYVSNPNNPMGTWWQAADVQNLREALPAQTILILDEAYADTAPPEAIAPIDLSATGIIRYRTFSKAYGLAGARIGYALATPSIVDAFDKVRNHYGINRIGQLGALAALQDQGYLYHVVGKITQARSQLASIAEDSGYHVVPSATNFVALDFVSSDRAERIFSELLKRGIFVRRPTVAQLARYIRVSCGTPQDLDIFSDTLKNVLRSL